MGTGNIGEQFTFLRPTDSCDSPSTEEFYHSLRLHQAGVGQHYILLPATSCESPFYLATQKAIVEQGATAELISFIPDASESNNLFLVMQWLYECAGI